MPAAFVVEYSRLVWFFVVMGVFAAVFQAGSMSDVSEQDARLFMEEFEDLVEGIDAFGIFVHNTTIALLMFVPGAGLVWGLISAWSTGFAFAAIGMSIPDAADISPLFVLFFTPFGLLEISAYSLAMSRSLLVAITAAKRQPVVSEHLRPALVEIGIVVALLLAGGYVEFYMIESVL